MSTAKVLAAVQRSKQFKALIESGLKLSSTDRQLANGTLAFTGKVKVGRKTIRPAFKITGNGAIISNEFVARRVDSDLVGTTAGYRQGVTALSEMLAKRFA